MLKKFPEQQAYFMKIQFPFELLPERNWEGIPLLFLNGLCIVTEEFLEFRRKNVTGFLSLYPNTVTTFVQTHMYNPKV